LAPTLGRMKKTLVLLIVLAAATAGGYGAWRAWAAPAGAAHAQASALAQQGDLEDTVSATGTLQPRDYVDVGTQVSGQVRKLHVKIGDTVAKGQLLAELDPTVYQSKVEASQAQLLNLQAQLAQRQALLKLAQQQAGRQASMMREQATTAEAVQVAEAELQSAKAQVQALQAQIQQTRSTLRGDQANLGYTRIFAPMSGTVVTENAKEGQTLNANQSAPILVRIADLSTMTVQTQVSEADVSRLKPGMPVYFTTLGDQKTRWTGTLRQVNPTPEVVSNVVLYNALFDVPNPDGKLMTQMTTQVFFVVAQARDAVLVPVTALRGSQVSVLKDDGTRESRNVEVGATNRVMAQIVSGLEPGERVAIGTQAPRGARAASAAPTRRMAPRL
jgi:membrane fusion protein, macrolide-specific efflux system